MDLLSNKKMSLIIHIISKERKNQKNHQKKLIKIKMKELVDKIFLNSKKLSSLLSIREKLILNIKFTKDFLSIFSQKATRRNTRIKSMKNNNSMVTMYQIRI